MALIPPTRFTCVVLASVLVAPASLHANVPVPSAFGFVAPVWLAIISIGLAFAGIVIVEATVLKIMLKLAPQRAFLLALLLNIVSSMAGALLGSLSTAAMLLLLAFILVFGYLYPRVHTARVSLLIAGLPMLLTIPWLILTFRHGYDSWAFWGSLVPAFLLTVYIETIVLAWRTKQPLNPRVVFIANLPSYALLIAILLVLRIQPLDNPVLTVDYHYTHGLAAAKHGDAAEALRAARLMQHEATDWLRVMWTVEIAEELAARDELPAAAEVLSWAESHRTLSQEDLGTLDRMETLRSRLRALREELPPSESYYRTTVDFPADELRSDD